MFPGRPGGDENDSFLSYRRRHPYLKSLGHRFLGEKMEKIFKTYDDFFENFILFLIFLFGNKNVFDIFLIMMIFLLHYLTFP